MKIGVTAALAAVVGSALTGALPSTAAAQLDASAGVGAGALGYRTVLPSSSAGVADAGVGYGARFFALGARGRLALFAHDSGSSEGALFAALRRPAGPRGIGAGAAVDASRTSYNGFLPSRRVEVTVGPTFALGAFEGAMRARMARLSLDGEPRDANGASLLVQRRWRAALLTLSADGLAFDDRALAERDTTYVVAGFPFRSRYQTVVDVRRAYVDLQAGMHLALPRGALVALTVGARGGPLSTDPGGWVQLRGTMPFSPQTALVVGVGRAPSVPEQELPSAPFATVTFRWTPLAGRAAGVIPVAARPADERGGEPRFAVASAGAGRIVRLTGVRASRVEIMGDFTDWSPLALAPAGEGVWEAPVALRSGTHRVVMRVDGGEWSPPPGLPVAADEFRGSAGVVVLE